jgi:hypothetical protein
VPPPLPLPKPPDLRPGAGLELRPGFLDFGSQGRKVASYRDVMLYNAGFETLQVVSVGLNGHGFILDTDLCTGRVMGGGESCRTTVAFVAGSPGSYRGALEVIYLADTRRRSRAELMGRLEPPPAAGRAILRPGAGSLDFGRVTVGSETRRSLELSNDGDAPLVVESLRVSGTGFDLAEDGCGGRPIPTGRSCTLRLRFTPSGRGDFSGSLEVGSNSAVLPRLEIPLRGEGAAVERPRLDADPDQLRFGRVQVGAVERAAVTLRNAGGGRLAIRDLRIEGENRGSFRVEKRDCPPLEAGERCRVEVVFEPRREGPLEAGLVIASGDGPAVENRIPLAGSGVAEPPPPPPRGGPCPQVNLDPLGGGEPRERVEKGTMPPESCLSYAVTLRERGALVVCVPQGYHLQGDGFELQRDEVCRVEDDPSPYRTWRRSDLDAGTRLKDVTVTRREGPARYRVLFRLVPRKGGRER